MSRYDEVKQKLAKRIFLNNLDDCKIFPKYLMIEPVYACNARCIMCGIYNKREKHNRGIVNMSEDLFKRLVDEMKPYSNWIEMVTMYGRGEPLLDNKLEEKIKKLSDIGIKQIQVSTNVSLLTAERAKKLFLCGLNDLRFSIDSIHKNVYESIRVGLKYDVVIKNALDAIDIRNEYAPNVPIRIRAVAMEVNRDEREEWLDFWQPRIKDIDSAQFLIYSSKSARDGDDSQERQYPCVSPFSTMVIRADGDVDLCCEALESEMMIGSVTKDSIKNVWQDSKFDKIRNLQLNYKWNQIPLCKGCILWDDNWND